MKRTKISLTRAISAVVLSAVAPLSVALAQSIQNDFDLDGTSDLTIVAIGSDKKLTWKSALSTTQQVSTLGSIGSAGDHLILAPWLGTSSPQIGVVTKDRTNDSIRWRIVDGNGTVLDRVLGSKNDLIVSGADLDGNGATEGVVARLVDGRVVWFIERNMFLQTGAVDPERVSFGAAGDRIFFASPDGLHDWLAVSRTVRKRTGIRMRNLLTGEIRNFSRFPKFISEGTRPRPFPVRGPDNVDLIGVERQRGSVHTVEFFNLNGVKVSNISLAGEGTLVVGDYSPDAGEEIAYYKDTFAVIFNPSSKNRTEVATVRGVAVDQININSLVTATDSGGSGNDGDSGSGSPSTGCTSVKSWPGSHIYKTLGSTHFSPTDIRRVTAGVVIESGGPGPFPSCAIVRDKDGNAIAEMGLYEKGNGWAARYYAGFGCGSDTAFGGSALASKARENTGSSSIYVDFDGTCYGPIDASRCVGSSQC